MHKGMGFLRGGLERKKRLSPGRPQNRGGTDAAGLREIFRQMFRVCGVLPDAVARQDPILLFETLAAAEEKREIPDKLKWMYGM